MNQTCSYIYFGHTYILTTDHPPYRMWLVRNKKYFFFPISRFDTESYYVCLINRQKITSMFRIFFPPLFKAFLSLLPKKPYIWVGHIFIVRWTFVCKKWKFKSLSSMWQGKTVKIVLNYSSDWHLCICMKPVDKEASRRRRKGESFELHLIFPKATSVGEHQASKTWKALIKH